MVVVVVAGASVVVVVIAGASVAPVDAASVVEVELFSLLPPLDPVLLLPEEVDAAASHGCFKVVKRVKK